MNTDTDLKTSVSLSLDASGTKLYPHYDFLLRDLWEMGADPAVMADLLQRNHLAEKIKNGVDLGCGKGAVSVHLAMEFNINMLGIDGYPPFVQDGMQRIRQLNLYEKCRLETGDVRRRIHELRGFDLVVHGSIGPVLGDLGQTLNTIRQALSEHGVILIDECYRRETADLDTPSRDDLLRGVAEGGFRVVDEYLFSDDEMKSTNVWINQCIKNRAQQLIQKYPPKRRLFEDYINKQQQESERLESHLTCLTWLLKKG